MGDASCFLLLVVRCRGRAVMIWWRRRAGSAVAGGWDTSRARVAHDEARAQEHLMLGPPLGGARTVAVELGEQQPERPPGRLGEWLGDGAQADRGTRRARNRAQPSTPGWTST